MTVSRNRTDLRLLLLSCSAALSVVAAAALAQGTGGPRSLLPPVLQDPGAGATDLVPAPAPAPVHPTELSPLPAADPSAPSPIALSPPVEAFTVVPSPGAPAPWLAGDPAPLSRALGQLPAPARSAVARDLTARLLAEDPASPELLARLAVLRAAAGDGPGLLRLTGRPDFAALPPEAIAAGVRGLAVADDRLRLCHAGLDRLAGPADANAEVLRAIALCRAVSGDAAGAQLAMDLAREQGPISQGFERLLAGLQGRERVGPDAVDAADVLGLWAARAQGLPLDGPVYAHPPALALGLLATAPAALEYRIDAAEQGVLLGIVPVEVLAALYAEGPPPTGAVAGLPPALRRASLRRAAVEASGPAVRAQAINALIDAGRATGLSAVLALVERRAIAELSSQSLPPAIGAGLVRAALLAGDTAPALAQLRQLAREAPDSRDFARLWPYRALLASAAGRGASDWIEAMRPGPDGQRRMALMTALLDGLQLPVDDELAAARPPPATDVLDSALTAGQRGLVLIGVLALLGDRSLAEVPPAEIGLAVSLLRRLDLGAEATALALEAALAAGL